MEKYVISLVFIAVYFRFAYGQIFTFVPPAPMRCDDDDDFRTYCAEFKKKGFCDTKKDIMDLACAKTCAYCPNVKFSKNISEIIKDQKKVAKVSGGDLEKVKEGLKEGKGLPTAQGDFDGKGETDAEKEATEVPEKEGEDGEKPEEGDKKPKDKGDKSKDKGDKSKDKGDDSKDKGDESKDKGDKSKDKGDESKDKGSKDKDGTKKPNKGEEPDPEEDVGEVGTTDGCDKKCQTECIQAHNKYRKNHGAPPLKWDKNLATQAQAVADKNAASNKFEHSDWAAGKGGECIAWGPVKPTWLIAVKDWHDEEKNYDFSTGKSSNGKAIGHFTQVVWKKATKVGCGVSEMTMYGSKGPFYIAQMDVVGIVQGKKELDLVGQPTEDDLDWFKGLREKQMKEAKSGDKRSQKHLHLGSLLHRRNLWKKHDRY